MILLDIIVGATVKDGLPTAHSLLSDAYQRHGWLFQPDVLPSGACPHENIAMEAMQSYSDQQNAELRERVKELEGVIEESIEIFKSQLFLEHKVNEAWEVLAKALKK